MTSRLEQLEVLALRSPGDSFIQYAIALEYVSVKRFEEAAEILERSMEKDPTYVPAFHQAARTYEQMDETEDARRCYELGIACAEQQGDTHARGEMEEALRMME